MKKTLLLLAAIVLATASASAAAPWAKGPLRVSANGRYFQQADAAPFFWLADTGWLITQKLDRAEIKAYFADRQAKGFNIIQLCAVQFLHDESFNGSLAVLDKDISKLNVTPGSNPADPAQYDYWDHVDYTIDTAAAHGIYLAIAPVWAHMVYSSKIPADQAAAYVKQIAGRYKNRPNIIWLNGGSGRESRNPEVWAAIGATLKKVDPERLVGYHPFGRAQTTDWYNNASWLDFNSFTSGHRRYDQDTEGKAYGEDNWRYVLVDRTVSPNRPTLDLEASYENTPQGLHDGTQPYWSDADVRRYAYWSVFAGAAGHTYGENSVRQVYLPRDAKPASAAKGFFMERLQAAGAGQMQHLRNLILSRPFFERANDQSSVADDEGVRYNRLLVTRGESYLFAYIYTGRTFTLNLGAISGATLNVSWFNPRTGEVTAAGTQVNSGSATFDPPGNAAPGNDWVLVLDDSTKNFKAPGVR